MKYVRMPEREWMSCEGCATRDRPVVCAKLINHVEGCVRNHVIFVEDEGGNEMNDALDLKVGDKVECDEFGEGVVTRVAPSGSPHCYYMVNFPNEGTISFSKKGHFSPGEPPKFKLRKVSTYPDITGATKVKIRTLDAMAKDPNLKIGWTPTHLYIKKVGDFSTWSHKSEGMLMSNRTLPVKNGTYNTSTGVLSLSPWTVEEVLERESDINVEYKITSNGKSVDIDTISDESLIALIRGGK